MLAEEYQNIYVENDEPVNKNKKVKLRKKTVMVTNEYYRDSVIAKNA
jgi:hypothetical protein